MLHLLFQLYRKFLRSRSCYVEAGKAALVKNGFANMNAGYHFQDEWKQREGLKVACGANHAPLHPFRSSHLELTWLTRVNAIAVDILQIGRAHV